MTAWESIVRTATPGALREVGDRCARSAEHVRAKGGGGPPRRFRRVIQALQSGDGAATLKAMRRVAPEFRLVIVYALSIEATLVRMGSQGAA